MAEGAPPGTGPHAAGRQHVVVTAGHVDHGKSTLVRVLTGMEPDRLAEERRRGLTIELGFAWLPLGAGSGEPHVAFVDVPGHERFVATMLAGAGPSPAALLVVAADDGWSAQSAEHRDVLALLGVPAVALVISKADLVEQARVDEVVERLTAEVADTSLAGAPLVVTDAVTGRGLDRLRDVLAERAPSLAPPRDRGRPRLWVDRSFAMAGAGTVVTGTLGDGPLHVGDTVALLPGPRTARVRGLQALGRPVSSVGPASRVAVNLSGASHDEVTRGDALVAGDGWRTTTEADLWIRTLPGHAVGARGAWHLHVGAAASPIRVLPVDGEVGGEIPGQGAVRVVLREPLPLVVGDRVVLREAGRRRVVAGGVVADPASRARPRGPAARRRHATALAALAAGSTDPVPGLLDLAGGEDDAASLLADAGLDPSAAPPAGASRLGTRLLGERLLDAAVAAAELLGPGVHDRPRVTAALAAAGLSPAARAPVADHLLARGTLVRAGGGLALAEHAEGATETDRRRARAVVAELGAEPLSPPDLDEVARRHGLERREVAALIQSGEVVRLGRVAFTRDAVETAAARLRELGRQRGAFTAAQARDAWGTTRRYAIPLLEHFDRTGLTEFDGQLRRLR